RLNRLRGLVVELPRALVGVSQLAGQRLQSAQRLLAVSYIGERRRIGLQSQRAVFAMELFRECRDLGVQRSRLAFERHNPGLLFQQSLDAWCLPPNGLVRAQ